MVDKWADDVFSRLMLFADGDLEYQNRLEACKKAEKDYLSVVDSLPETDRDCIEKYISACGEMDYRLAQLVYLYREKL